MLEILFSQLENHNTLIILFTIVVISLFIISNGKKPKNCKLPPGPRGIPLLGNILGMVKNPHLKLSKWATEYGHLYTLKLAHRRAVVVSDVKLMKELFGTMASTGKLKMATQQLISQGPYGILGTEGNIWLEQSQFCLRNLKQLGFGDCRSMEPLILDEVHKVCEWIKRERNKGDGIVHLENVLHHATINSLWTLVTGEAFRFGDSEMGTLLKEWIETLQYTMKTGLGFFDWLKYIAPNLSGFVAYDKACKNIHSFVGKLFNEHKETFKEGQIRNLIDAYIEHMEKINNSKDGEKSSFYGKEGWLHSMTAIVELFIAGGETVANSLNWGAIYLSCHEDIQKKLQSEIDQVIGNDRDPSLLDRARMPYTEAVILETLRQSSIAILGVPHELLEDITFHEYVLPKGLILMPNLYCIHHDPEIWGDPENFRPERFLGVDGDRLKGHLVPFQAGKRQCLGEPLAKDAMFLFVAKLFQQFQMKTQPNISKEDYLKPDVGITLRPTESGLIITSR